MPYQLIIGAIIGLVTGLSISALFIVLTYRMAQIHAAEED